MKKLELKFANKEGKTVTYSIDHPIVPADPTAVNAAMDEILKQNAFSSSGGELLSKKSARIVERIVEEIDIN
ncbi:MAG: DUF2922 domain-containing protein [Bacillota bacterium]|uniref:DUF2922 domain-containing protein n=1 Tax=Virgibacillus salarius TaxID=447199 RepID=A0A941IAW1_9BACI|nr:MULTISPECIES: DUF2922 domain-containing protein [Bacillaceae]NAZ08495.1 DUF2922 family protein [Agaribacter marinus]MBR7795782.1 DUF2922 domain-containing protein [Virgibacillus salarius]MCC2248668.1 DUF2922 domain-containing protein [Virgibacillus sp. AGTR]MDY7044959.1 DUF2922 domain-containing protein [Virgibacillus sp. M23]QRZ18424.1 DUF2922 domain-containing protein [Virgibacillus sp. AGTR]